MTQQPLPIRQKKVFKLKNRKLGEDEVRNAFERKGWYFHKFRDVSLCPHCGVPLPKADNKPDYMIAPVWGYVEVKDSGADGSYKFLKTQGGVTQIQEDRMNEKPDMSWIFLLMVQNDEKQAFFIPWVEYKEKIKALQKLQSSLPIHRTKKLASARDIFGLWELIKIGGAWDLPEVSWTKA